jgi:hypothetical protein
MRKHLFAAAHICLFNLRIRSIPHCLQDISAVFNLRTRHTRVMMDSWNGCHNICATYGIRTVEHWHLRTNYTAFFSRRSELHVVAGFIAFRKVIDNSNYWLRLFSSICHSLSRLKKKILVRIFSGATRIFGPLCTAYERVLSHLLCSWPFCIKLSCIYFLYNQQFSHTRYV